ncbi:hypothetical protein LTR86_003973 [Recurvomyces mirabilis]|nr:hypothetical protein LTR86_003973 [Recurvomyces mirabilis]
MKLSTSALLPALCWTVRLASAGQVYVYDAPMDEMRPAQALSPEAARLVLAQRAGVEDYHSVDLNGRGVVKAINDFGRRTSLLEQPTERRQQAFILLEGVEASELKLPYHSHTFTITSEPDVRASRGLWVDLAKQASPATLGNKDDDSVYETMAQFREVREGEPHFSVSNSADKMQDWISDLFAARTHDIVIYFAPSESKDRSAGTMQQWGTYEMPDTQSPLQKRSSPQQEAPLEEETHTSYLPVQSSTAPISSLAQSSPLPGILPACFATQSACESATRNCTGHGQCRKSYTDKSAADTSKARNCYSCSCSASVLKENGKTKTTYWGGPACQKKDVSVEFWMIALFTVFMIFLIGFAIGQVWEMGSEELPSVIGAGVSGPVKRS